MATTIQQIETPKRLRALDTSTGWQAVSAELFTTADGTSIVNEANGHAAWTAMVGAQSATKAVVSSGQYHGSYAVKYTPAAGSGNGDGVYMDLNTYCTVGKTYEISIFGKHAGDGTTDNNHYIRLASSSSLSAASDYYKNLSHPQTGREEFQEGETADEAWSERFVRFTHSADTRYLGARESGSSNDGSLILDSLSIKEVRYFPNNNHGQIYSGRALEFDGVTDYLLASTAFSETTHTVCVWAYVIADSDTKYIFDSRDGNNDGILLAFTSTETLQYSVNSNDLTTSIAGQFDNTWVRIVATYDKASTTQSLYLNGVLFSSSSSDQTVSTTANVYIGRIHSSNTSNFNGMMSDIQAWNASFTAEDVAYDYLNPESLALNRGGTSLTNSNLKIWYPMQDGHRGQQSYVLDASNTGLGSNLTTPLDLTTWSVSQATDITANSFTVDASGKGIYYPLVVGTTYKVNISKSAGDIEIKYRTSNSGSGTTLGTFDTDLYHTASGSTPNIYLRGTGGTTATITSASIIPVNDKNHATTVFYGDEQISATNDRTFAGTSNWGNAAGVNAFNAYDETTSGVLTVTPDDDASNRQYATLDGANWEDADGDGPAMVVGRTYRLSYDLQITSFTKGQLNIGFCNDSFVLKHYHSHTAQGSYSSSTNQTLDIVYLGTSDHTKLIIDAAVSSVFTAKFDNFSIKEVGVATGWTDADQQLHIPQTVLQSYNELAWSLPTTASNMIAEVANNADFDINSSDFTANFWVYLNDHGFGNGQYLFHKGGGGNEGWHIRIKADGEPALVVHTGGSGGDGVSAATANGSANDIKIGRWYMITGVVDHGSTVALYVNGELAESTSFPSETGDDGTGTSTDLSDIDGAGKLGMLNWTTSYAAGTLNGTVTEFSIFKGTGAALSKAEINELYNDGKALDVTTHSKVANLKGYWRNNGLNTTWKNIYNPGTHDATLINGSETILIPQGVDSSRDSQGFIMNRQRNTSSLNFPAVTAVGPTLNEGSYVEIQDNPTLNFGTGVFSIEGWAKAKYRAKPNAAGTASTLNTIFHLGDGVADSDSSGICSVSTTKLGFYVGGQLCHANATFTEGNWYHIVGVREGTGTDEIKIYIDGVLQSDTETYAGSITNTHNPGISFDSNSTRRYEEAIDGIKVYNKALSLEEVKRNYNATKGSHRN